MTTPDKQAQLDSLMQDLGIEEEDLIEKFIRGSGHGGQKINKTSSTVYLKHVPTGIEVKCQRERSQALNRFFARLELCEQIQQRRAEASQRRKRARAAKRKINRRPSRAQTQRRLNSKKMRSETKSMRKKPSGD